MGVRLKLLSRLDNSLKSFKVCILHIHHLNFVHGLLQHLADSPISLFVIGRKQIQSFARFTDTSRSSAAMHVDFSIERTLVVDHILNVWNIKTSGGNISAYQNSCCFLFLLIPTHLYSLALNSLDPLFEPV